MGLSGKRVPGLVQPHHFLHIIRNSKHHLQEKTGFEQEQVRTEDQGTRIVILALAVFNAGGVTASRLDLSRFVTIKVKLSL
ncbi:hypothetical protein V6N13_093331 [Hibiscus sabdariffa]